MHLTCTNMPTQKLDEALQKVRYTPSSTRHTPGTCLLAARYLSEDTLLCTATYILHDLLHDLDCSGTNHSQLKICWQEHARSKPELHKLYSSRTPTSTTCWPCVGTRPRVRTLSRQWRAASPQPWTWSSTSGTLRTCSGPETQTSGHAEASSFKSQHAHKFKRTSAGRQPGAGLSPVTAGCSCLGPLHM